MNDPGRSAGHQFHFAVTVQGSYAIVGDSQHYDCEPNPDAEPLQLTVRAWDLAAACRVAAETPFAAWKYAEEL